MASLSVTPSRSFLASFLPIVRASLFPARTEQPIARIPLLSQLRTSLLPIPGIIDTLWEGILRAVPKKKTSHMKKRHRFMAGKGLKDVTALNKCSACGRPKRAHVLCPYCVQSIRRWFGTGFQTKKEVDLATEQEWEKINEELVQRGKRPVSQERLEKKGVSGVRGSTK